MCAVTLELRRRAVGDTLCLVLKKKITLFIMAFADCYMIDHALVLMEGVSLSNDKISDKIWRPDKID